MSFVISLHYYLIENLKAKDLIPIEDEIQKKLMKHFAGIWIFFILNLFHFFNYFFFSYIMEINFVVMYYELTFNFLRIDRCQMAQSIPLWSDSENDWFGLKNRNWNSCSVTIRLVESIVPSTGIVMFLDEIRSEIIIYSIV